MLENPTYCTAVRGVNGLLQAGKRIVKCIQRWQWQWQWQRQWQWQYDDTGNTTTQAIARNGNDRFRQWQCNVWTHFLWSFLAVEEPHDYLIINSL
jgi:hypothetical protein